MGAPGGASKPEAEPAMVELLRGGLVESVHRLSLAVTDPTGRLVAWWGDPELRTFMRSSAKPFQALPAVASGAVDAAGFEPAELALMCASHAGTDRHAELTAAMLAKIGCTVSDLRCGVHPPFDQPTAEALACAGQAPDALRNNCSGKHSGMLAFARHLGAPLASYLEPEHPVQRAILADFARMTGLPEGQISTGIDGCSAPNFAVPLRSAARAFARLMDFDTLTEPQADAARRIVSAMTAFPELVSGAGRFDTELMRITNGTLLSKGGAEGYQCIGLPAGALRGKQPALGLALKVHDGDPLHRASTAAMLQVLAALGAISPEQRAGLARFDVRQLPNLAGLPVGELRIAPGFELRREQDGPDNR